MATTKTIRIKVESKKAKRSVDSLDNSMKGLGRSANRTTKSMGKLSAAAAAVSAALAVGQIVKYTDAFNSAQNQIRQTTKSTEELTKRTNQLFEIANRSRTSIGATAELYTQLTLSTEKLNLTTEEQLRLTESIGKSFTVSGKTAAEAAGAIRQLGQAFASGALRGDEFNSVAEGAPEIMRAIQKATGRTQGELRKLAAEGAITSSVLVKSLLAYSDVIDEKASQATTTFAQNLEVATNNVTKFVGENNEIQKSVSFAGEALVFMSEHLDDAVNAMKAMNFQNRIALHQWSRLKDLIDPTAAALRDQTRAFEKLSKVEIEDKFSEFVKVQQNLNNELAATEARIQSLSEGDVSGKGAFGLVRAQEKAAELRAELDRVATTLSALSAAQLTKNLEGATEVAASELAQPGKPLEKGGGEEVSITKPIVDLSSIEKDFLTSEQSKTEILKSELNERRALNQAFGQFLMMQNMSEIDQMKAQSELIKQEQMARFEARKMQADIEFEERMARMLEEVPLESEQRILLEAEFELQRIEQQKIFAEERLRIQQEEQERSNAIEKRKHMNNLSLTQSFMQAGFALSELFGSKSEKANKKRRKREARINGAAGIVRAWADHSFYEAIAMTVAIAASTEAQIKAMDSAGTGGKISVSAGGIGAQGDTAERQEPIAQQSVLEFRGLAEVAEELRTLDPGEVLPVEYTQRIVASLDEYNRLGGGGTTTDDGFGGG